MSRALLHLMIALQAAASGLVPLVLCIHPDGEVEVRTGALLDSCCRPARAEAPPDRQPEARPRSGSPCPGCQDVSLGASSPQAFPMRTAAPPIGLESSAVAAAPCLAAAAPT